MRMHSHPCSSGRRVRQVGDYLVHVHQHGVMVDGVRQSQRVPIGGSPFPIKVVAGPLDAYCKLAIPLLKALTIP